MCIPRAPLWQLRATYIAHLSAVLCSNTCCCCRRRYCRRRSLGSFRTMFDVGMSEMVVIGGVAILLLGERNFARVVSPPCRYVHSSIIGVHCTTLYCCRFHSRHRCVLVTGSAGTSTSVHTALQLYPYFPWRAALVDTCTTYMLSAVVFSVTSCVHADNPSHKGNFCGR